MMMWEKSLRGILSDEDVDFGNMASILVDLFEGVVVPDIFLTHANKVAVQQIFSVKMGGSKKLGKLLCQPGIFCSLPTLLQKGIFDLLYIILRRGTYDVTRFQYRVVECEGLDSAVINEDNSQSINLNRVLLDLLQHFSGITLVNSSQQICKKIIRLLGVTFTAGCTPEDLKEMLFFLRTPSSLTLPLLQTMKSVMKQDISMTKGSPSTFFSFGGYSSGIYSVFGPFPFTREYQFFTWFRIDKFESANTGSTGDSELHSGRQHIISVVDSAFNGIDVYIEQNALTISVGDSKTPATVIRFGSKEVRFTRGVWYHIAVRHAKPRLSLFSKDEMSIHIDKILVFQDFVRFPNAAQIGSTSLVCGRNFNGQIGPVYFLNESLPFPAVEAIARLDVGKSVDSSSATNEGFSAVIAADLLQSIGTADRKIININPKFTSVFHPARCKYGHALDVHGGRHAVLGPLTFTWIVHTARDVLEAMGGIACLLIMFPKLLIESEDAVRYLGPERFKGSESESGPDDGYFPLDASTTLNESFSSGLTEFDSSTLLDDSLAGVLDFEYDEASDSGCVGLLLSIIAHTLAGHRSYQRTIASMSAIEMIEFVMKAVPEEVMGGEGDGCILALLQLRSAVADYPALELRVTRRLICNFAAWTRCSFQFQSSLLSVVSASIKSQPDYFSANLGVQGLLDMMRVCFMDGADLQKPTAPAAVKPVATSYKTLLPMITDNLQCESPCSPSHSNRGSFLVEGSGSTTLGSSCIDFGTIETDTRSIMARKKSLINMLTGLTESGQGPGQGEGQEGLVDGDDKKSVELGSERGSLSDTPEVISVTAQLFQKQVSFDEAMSDSSEEGLRDEVVTANGTDVTLAHINELTPISAQRTKELDSYQSQRSSRTEHTPNLETQNKKTDPASPLLDRQQRTYLRSSVLSMIMSLTQHFSSDREIRPLLHFISYCKDAVVIVEIAQLLLCLLVEGGSKVISVVTEVCGGPEEFAAFVIQKMIKSPSEDVRCLGLRLLTHFYMRADLLPMSLLSLTLKRRKGSMLSRTMDKLSMMAGGVGMRRLQASGGFALLEEALSAQCESNTDRTYAALLEMLLTKCSTRSPATVQYSNLSEEYATASASLHLLTGTSSILGAGCLPNRMDSKVGGSAQRDRSVIFALSPEQVLDEGIDLTNAVALSFVLDSLPQLPVAVQGQIYRDILAIINRSGNNREVFRTNPSWHLSLFALTSQLMTINPPQTMARTNHSGIVRVLAKKGSQSLGADWVVDAPWSAVGSQGYQKNKNEERVFNGSSQLLSVNTSNQDLENSSKSIFSPLSMPSPNPSESLKDAWFRSSMEIYSNLLTRAMDVKAGWREIERTLSQSKTSVSVNSTVYSTPKLSEMTGTDSQKCNDIVTIKDEDDAREVVRNNTEIRGSSVARAVLSNLLSEMTVSIRAKYKDLHRLARSTRSKENQAGLDRMENILTLILSASQFILADVVCAGDDVGDLHIGRLRAHYYNEVIEEKAQLDLLILDTTASLQALEDGVFSEEDPDSPGDCSCLTSSLPRPRTDALDQDRGTFSPSRVPGNFDSAPLSARSDDSSEGKVTAARFTNYFDLAEERLVQRYGGDSCSYSPASDDLSPCSAVLSGVVNFEKTWITMNTSEAGPSPKSAEPSNESRNTDKKAPVSVDSKKSRTPSIGELLNTLKRGQDPDEGRLGLVLQTLQLFDAIFWPHKSGTLRNKHMLRFIKAQTQAAQQSSRSVTPGPPPAAFTQSEPVLFAPISSQTGPVPLESSSGTQQSTTPPLTHPAPTPALLSPKGAPLQSPISTSKTLPVAPVQAPSISLYTSIIRLSLNAFQMLSPLTDLASLNVRRLHELLLSQEKVSPYTTPVDDWLLAAVLHVTVNLQRVASSLFPIFHKIAINVPLLTVPIMGPESARETYEAAFRHDSTVLSAVAGEEDTVAQLEGLFDSSEGAALIKYSKDCMHLLHSVLGTRRPLLEKALEPRVFEALVLFSERISKDMDCQSSDRSGSPRGSFQPINEVETSSAINGATGGGTPSGDGKISERTDSTGAAAVFESPPKASGGEPIRTPSMIAPLSRMKNWYMGGGNGKDSPAHDGISTDRGSGKSSGQATPSLSATNSQRDINGKDRVDTGDAMRDQGDGIGIFMRRELRSQSEGSDSESSVCSGSIQSTSVLQTINRTYFTEADRHISQEAKETDCKATEESAEDTVRPLIRWLKLLRDPYLKMNALRSVGVVKSVTALEHHEAACAKGFADDLIALRSELEEHRDLSKKSAEEVTELRELSSTIVVSLSCLERARQSSVRSNDSMLLKKVASNWHDCLSTFEMDWSPWADDLSGNKSPKVDEEGRRLIRSGCRIDGVSEYEISELRDSRMRRMILTRAADPVDHRDSAYREGKQRGSWNKDASFTSQRDHSASFTTQRASFLQLDLSKIRNIGGAAWGDDADLADGMGSSVHGDLPGSPISGPGSVREEVNGGGLGGAGMGIIGGLGALVFTSGTAERRPDCSYVFQWAPEERMQAMFTVTQVQLELMISGVLVLTNKTLYFHPNKIVGGLSTNKKPLTDHRWHIDRLLEAYGRRFLLQNCAIELFFADSPEVYVAFSTLAELQRFFRCLKRQNVPNLHASTSRSLDPRVVFANSPWTDLWRRRLISNFEYLMRLNILAGRSYNDITQYPVFPWIIADYTSEVLDLHDPGSFRDLSKPVGALNPVRLAEIKERYDSFDSDIMPPFMYGSHYSSAGVVIHYMMRQEPFTTMFVNLQGGKFDCPDRVFFDIKSTWDCCNKDRSDVKELIPELFCCPETLINTSRLPLGELQEGRGVVDDVLLPPWAQADAFEFVRLHREALESDYVSEHLHEWIDLIFGYKQTGPASVLSHNVFHYLSYENAIDIEAIEDPIDREAAKGHVTHFGQTPAQLTSREHLPRLPRDECMIPLCSDIYNISRLTLFTPPKQLENNSKHGAVISVRSSADRLIVVHEDLSVSYYRWSSFPDGEGSPFQLRPEKTKFLPCSAMAKSEIELRKKSFVPIPPIDTNMQRCPQVSVSSPRTSPAKKEDEKDATLDGIYGKVEVLTGTNPSLSSAKEPPTSTTNKSSWSFFGSIRKTLPVSQSSPPIMASPDKPRSPSKKVLASRSPRSEGSAQGSFDDCESDAEYEDDEDSTFVAKGEDDGEIEITFSSAGNTPMSPKRAAILKELALASKDSLGTAETPTASPLKNLEIPAESSNTQPDLKATTESKNSSGLDWSQKEKSSFVPLESSKLSEMNCKNIALSVGELGSGRLVSCGYWDNTLKVHALDSLREIASVNSGHLGEIVCVQLGYQGGHTLITGGSDGTVRVWILENPSLASSFSPDANNISNTGSSMNAPLGHGASLAGANNIAKNTGGGVSAPTIEGESTHRADASGNSGPEPSLVCAHVLCGHNSPVTAISYATDLDIALSGSRSGLLCLHSVRKGTFIRSISHVVGAPVDLVLATSPGYLISHSWSNQNLHVFWINGQHRATVRTATRVETMAVNGPANVLVCGHTDGRISLRAVWNLQQTHIVTHSSHGAIKCLWFTEDYQFLLIGSADGTVSIGTDPDVRWKLLHAAIQKTPLLGPPL